VSRHSGCISPEGTVFTVGTWQRSYLLQRG
jgi:hypothetical protein